MFKGTQNNFFAVQVQLCLFVLGIFRDNSKYFITFWKFLSSSIWNSYSWIVKTCRYSLLLQIANSTIMLCPPQSGLITVTLFFSLRWKNVDSRLNVAALESNTKGVAIGLMDSFVHRGAECRRIWKFFVGKTHLYSVPK